jgi:RimJ/RimL family protein N-acetyltransferase
MKEAIQIIETDRCLLRHSTASDARALLAAVGAPEFPYDLPLASLNRQGKLNAWLDSILEMSANGKACVFSIDLRTGEECIGQVSLVRRDQYDSWNLAFWLHPCSWGKGLALEAAKAVVQYAFTDMPIEEIWAGANLWNQRSIKTLLGIGLRPAEETGPSNGTEGSQSEFKAFSVRRDYWLQKDRNA